MPDKKVRILITAFDTDKGEFAYNVSKETLIAVTKYLNLLPDQVELVGRVLPVEMDGTGKRLRELLDEVQPDFVIEMGQSGREGKDMPMIAYETRARNTRMTAGTASVPIQPGGKDLNGFFTVNMTPKDGVTVAESNDAGEYVCNYAYYRILDWMKTHGKGNNAVLMHQGWERGEGTAEETAIKLHYFAEHYASHLFGVTLAAAGIVETQRAARDGANPLHTYFAGDALSTPSKNSVATVQYQLLKLGLLEKDPMHPFPITGVLDPATLAALTKLEPAPGMLLPTHNRIDLAQFMLQAEDYEKRMQAALKSFHSPEKPEPSNDTEPKRPMLPTAPTKTKQNLLH